MIVLSRGLKRCAAALFLTGCASINRDCQSYGASNFGADWIVLQYGYDGKPINCWKLNNAAITNEGQSDGIYWQAHGGHMVHISGWYNRVQVTRGDYETAAKQLGVDLSLCGEGTYKDVRIPVVVPPEPWSGSASPAIEVAPPKPKKPVTKKERDEAPNKPPPPPPSFMGE